ncbi:MAG: hypothetical protein GY861_14715 [bacterium]|nr:hypothetical protein [bacterium]
MSYLPRMIYKDGVPVDDHSKYRIPQNIDELLGFANEGFFPTGKKSLSETVAIPEVASMVNAKKAKQEKEKEVNENLEKALNEPVKKTERVVFTSSDTIAKYEKETGKKAKAFGKETKAFKKWSKENVS